MYEGSMYGSGVAVFAVWGYVISNADRGHVELNPRKLAHTLGGTVEEIEAAIQYLESADPRSRHKERDGRRLIRESEYQFFIPCWDEYQRIRNEEQRQQQNRESQARFREKNKLTPEERVALRNKRAEELETAMKAKLKNGFLKQNLENEARTTALADAAKLEMEGGTEINEGPFEYENDQDDNNANFNEFPTS